MFVREWIKVLVIISADLSDDFRIYRFSKAFDFFKKKKKKNLSNYITIHCNHVFILDGTDSKHLLDELDVEKTTKHLIVCIIDCTVCRQYQIKKPNHI